MIVVDTNAIVHLLLGGERTEDARRVFRQDAEWAAPILWRSEFRSVLSLLIRRRGLELADGLEAAREAQSLLSGREYHVETQPVLELSVESGCSSYDCEFVVLARDLGVPLVTSDGALLKAFPELAVLPRRFA